MGESTAERLRWSAKEKLSRRKFLKRAGKVAVGVAALGAMAGAGWLVKEGRSRRPTVEQEKARLYFDNPNLGTEFVENIVVAGEAVGGRTFVSLRNRPAFSMDSDLKLGTVKEGERIDKLNRGEVVPKAIVVWGQDRKLQAQGRNQWYAFPNPKTGEMVFAYARLFEHDPGLLSVNPIDLSKPVPILTVNREVASK